MFFWGKLSPCCAMLAWGFAQNRAYRATRSEYNGASPKLRGEWVSASPTLPNGRVGFSTTGTSPTYQIMRWIREDGDSAAPPGLSYVGCLHTPRRKGTGLTI